MTQVLQADDQGLARAAELLRCGRLVAFGTETVYGLGGDATDDRAVAAIFAAKRRPAFNPLISHYYSVDAALLHVVADARAQAVAKAFWPGPLTLVLPRRPDCPVTLLAGAGLDTMAVRVPDHPVALALLRLVDRPIAAPSANVSGAVSPTCAAHVLQGLSGRIDAVLDSGPCSVGVESTVLDLSGAAPVLLRPGGAAVEALEAFLGPIQRERLDSGSALRSPGLMESHYAPMLPVRLNATEAAQHEALLAFGPSPPPARCLFQLSATSDTTEAAARLFSGLRWLDAEGARLGASRIAVMAVPMTGLGLAINDRLRRAAAPRA